MAEHPVSEHSASEVGHITQGRRRTVVDACASDDSIWVEVRRHHGKPWEMTPELARGLAGLLHEAADRADQKRRS